MAEKSSIEVKCVDLAHGANQKRLIFLRGMTWHLGETRANTEDAARMDVQGGFHGGDWMQPVGTPIRFDSWHLCKASIKPSHLLC